MIKRTTEQWLTLLEAHQQSGVSQAQFCKEHGLCTKYFSLRRRQLHGTREKSTFVRVGKTRALPVVESELDWQLQIGEMRLRVLNAPVSQIVNLLKGLI